MQQTEPPAGSLIPQPSRSIQQVSAGTQRSDPKGGAARGPAQQTQRPQQAGGRAGCRTEDGPGWLGSHVLLHHGHRAPPLPSPGSSTPTGCSLLLQRWVQPDCALPLPVPAAGTPCNSSCCPGSRLSSVPASAPHSPWLIAGFAFHRFRMR